MVLPKYFLLIINITVIQFHLISITICQPTNFLNNYCEDTYGNYTNNSTYKVNLNTLLSSISSHTPPMNGFYNLSIGHDPNKANGIALCRGDVTVDDCHTCLQNATIKLPQLCPTQKEAIAWYNFCMLRYSSNSMLGVNDEQPYFVMNSIEYMTKPEKFNQVLGNLLNNLSSQAASGNTQQKYAIAEAPITDFQKVYALTQCTPDLSQQKCISCLEYFIGKLPTCCANRKGARVVGPSCAVRYETYQFYVIPNVSSSSPPIAQSPQPSTNSTSSQGKGGDTTKVAITIVIPVLVLSLTTIAIIFYFFYKKGKTMKTNSTIEDDDNVCTQFDFNTIKIATQNFSEDNKLGRGGFGLVYKGTLDNGQEIAVKRLLRNSGQGDQEFKNEVSLVAKLQHRNLVRLLGFCLENEERLLIYEFVENASLDQFLFDSIKRTYLNWGKRLKIITGIARGILYLHEDSRLRIIHRDLKASNILLDADLNPKISDFGMAKLFDANQTRGDTNRIAGTYGYMPPEYAMHGLFSVKSDVYSFGVLILEIITGRKSCDFHGEEDNEEDLITFVWRNWRQKTTLDMIDPSLSIDARIEITRCIHIGLLCIQNTADDRPTMSSVVLMLSSHSLTIPMPSTPAFLTQTHPKSMQQSTSSSIGTTTSEFLPR